ncbi:putative undecaprenyl diphosphate synthase-domain-containing protein [Lipomyces tetrasporus]|uniref:Alkyl transferase n=1 Tax=Lipomyces tetrasporus TaxID=54092 RepID=A0AAD7QKE3_9ASCO|nr:putative undecaprenyl diphosphate synthase-domain-containing protein [Lipomyces tetrasporus]KAJ8096708.1 putative undecaprenyl diphosphate synthase-domain-containing protein [Lipomyces tetrasporus]
MAIASWIRTFPLVQYLIAWAQEIFMSVLKTGPVPQHVAFVMDGNRRFARRRKLEVREGHSAGFESLAHILEMCYQVGIKVVTVYAFSIENFKRPTVEVDALMEIARTKLLQIIHHGDLADRFGISIRVLGQRNMIPADVLAAIDKSTEMTKGNTTAILNICFPYTSRDDIATSMREVVTLSEKHELEPETIDEGMLEQHMYTKDCPPLDILVRTSGVERLSDFMLWQSHQDCTVEFVDCLWPEFEPWRFGLILLKWSRNKAIEFRKTEMERDQKEI